MVLRSDTSMVLVVVVVMGYTLPWSGISVIAVEGMNGAGMLPTVKAGAT